MKCNHCGKLVPSVSKECPYCHQTIDESSNSEINFGEYQSSSNLNSLTTMDSIKDKKEPKRKKSAFFILMIVIIIVTIIIGFLVLIPKGSNTSSIYLKTLNKIYNIIYDDLLGTSSSKSGKYNLVAKINKEKIGFKGTYQLDVNNKLVFIEANSDDPNENSNDVILDSKDFNGIFYMENNNFYFNSAEIFNKTILFPYDDLSGYLKTKNYDLESIISGKADAIKEAFKVSTYEEEKTEIDYLGSKTKVKKLSLKLDNKAKRIFLTKYYNSLIDNSNYLNEIARLENKTSEEEKKILKNYLTTAEYRYSATSSNYSELNIYLLNREVIRLEYDATHDEDNKYLKFDIGKNKYYFTYNKNNKNIFDISLSKILKEKDESEIRNITYDITYDSDNYKIDATLNLEDDINAVIKKQKFAEIISVRDLTSEDIDNVKNNIRYYNISNLEFIDNIVFKFRNKCTSDLVCNCIEEKKTCECNYNNEIIICPLEDINN